MSRAGGKASRERKRVDAALRKLEDDAAADFMLAACERCGLVQVQPSSPDWTAIVDIHGEELPPAGTVCVLCGNETARFFTPEPGSL